MEIPDYHFPTVENRISEKQRDNIISHCVLKQLLRCGSNLQQKKNKEQIDFQLHGPETRSFEQTKQKLIQVKSSKPIIPKLHSQDRLNN
jgi:hypothetical protein